MEKPIFPTNTRRLKHALSALALFSALTALPASAQTLDGFSNTQPPIPPLWSILEDADQDGMTDLDEILSGMDPLDPEDGLSDLDGDDIELAWEFAIGTNPDVADTDTDDWSDSEEYLLYGTDPLNALSFPLSDTPASGGDTALETAIPEPETVLPPPPPPPSLSNGDFSSVSITTWKSMLSSTQYQGGGFVWNAGAITSWSAYVGTTMEVWDAGGEKFVELDGSPGNYGIKQEIANPKAGGYVLAWRQSGRNSTRAGSDPYRVKVYYLNGTTEVPIAQSTEFSGFSKMQWTDNALGFQITPEQINSANSIIYVAFIPKASSLNTYGTLIDKVSLLPVEVVDIRSEGDTDDQVIDFILPVPTPNQGETDADFWQRRNAYYQQQLPEKSIAYIEPHRAANNSPDMPRLVARIPGAPATIKLKWRLEVEYLRGNGYRASYVEDFTRPEDKVMIPTTVSGYTAYTDEINGDQEWRMFESTAWQSEIAKHGFFGGTAKVYMWIPSASSKAPIEPFITFRIGGKNPDQTLARTFLNAAGGTTFPYLYAIGRHETFGRVRVNGVIRYYNQFYTEYQGGPIGNASVDMGWAAWAKGWPIYNLDRGGRGAERYQNGPGGYGMFQLTLGPKHPATTVPINQEQFISRRQIWNWQDNVLGAVTELQGKHTLAVALQDGLATTYPKWPALPNEGRLSGLDAIVVTFYNGTGGLPSRTINKINRKTPWTANKTRQLLTWDFHQNQQDYVQAVNLRINNIIP